MQIKGRRRRNTKNERKSIYEHRLKGNKAMMKSKERRREEAKKGRTKKGRTKGRKKQNE